MSRYVIEIAKEYEEYFKGILICGIADGKFAVDVIAREDLEELNSDYINENFGDLQDTAYQRGFEDGKWKSEDGCTGCKYEGKVVTGPPYISCCNSYKNQWTAKQTDDKIEVGDEVEWDNDFTGDRFIVTRIFQPRNMKEQCDGIDDDGDVYRAVLIESLVKTGRHFDIASILEDMRND